jgi:hypothetical protein
MQDYHGVNKSKVEYVFNSDKEKGIFKIVRKGKRCTSISKPPMSKIVSGRQHKAVAEVEAKSWYGKVHSLQEKRIPQAEFLHLI